MRAVNLLPRETIAAERQSLVTLLPLIGGALVPIIALGLLILGYSSANTLVTTRSSELANLEAAMPATIPASVAAAAPDLDLINASISSRESALDGALSDQTPWDTTLSEIARLIPSGVWLTTLSAATPNDPAKAALATSAAAAAAAAQTTTTTSATTTTASTPAPAATTAAFSMAGSAYTEQDLAELLARLQLLPILTGVTLTSDSITPVGTKNVVEFSISASVQAPSTGAGS